MGWISVLGCVGKVERPFRLATSGNIGSLGPLGNITLLELIIQLPGQQTSFPGRQKLKASHLALLDYVVISLVGLISLIAHGNIHAIEPYRFPGCEAFQRFSQKF